MKIILARVLPEDGELLCDMYWRVKENIDIYTDKHKDTTIVISRDENCLLIKSLKLEENVN